MYVTATINGLPFFTHRAIDERVREAVRADVAAGLLSTKADVGKLAIEAQWGDFLRWTPFNGWVH